jgi:hypothetical protein
LFTFRSIRQLLRDSGFRIQSVRGVPAPFPKVLGDGLLGRAAVAANLGLIRLSKTLFSYQIFIEAESTPDVDFLVRDAQVRSGVAESQTRESASNGVQLGGEGGRSLEPSSSWGAVSGR